VVSLAPRAPWDSVRPRRLSGVVVRPLNFTVRPQTDMPRLAHELAAIFAEGVVAQCHCISEGDAARGNGHAARYIEAASDLLAGGPAHLDAFCVLLEHPDASVRGMAAAYLLKDRTDQALSVLRALASGEGLASLGARATLERYKRGVLTIV
jgi:hypothetical protein